jgi:REP element-mobilizing transposase RayT
LPIAVIHALQAEAEIALAEAEREPAPAVRVDRLDFEHRRFFARWDKELDKGLGPVWLSNPAVAALVAECLRFHDGTRYILLAFCVMSNHVHVVFTPLLREDGTYYSLAQIMHTVKGYTAGRANRLLGRSGAFWQHESYDHVVRDAAELDRIIAYVVNNPVKAGLVSQGSDWPWTYLRDAP